VIVVTGATGNVGRPLVRRLAASDVATTAVSRHITSSDVPAGVRVVAADLQEPESLRPAFEGARSLFLHDGQVSSDQYDARAILKLAESAGVERVVVLSSQGVRTRPDSRSHGVLMQDTEDAVRESGLAWTIVRSGGLASNTFHWAESIRTGRTVVAPFGDVGIPVVHPGDIADVATAALLDSRHVGQVYELTGPALLTPRELTTAIGDVLGDDVEFVELSAEQAAAQMLQFMPAWAVETTLAVLGQPTPAEQEISPDTQSVLGRPPRAFEAWIRENVAAFR
jgi:uncharacterized protein YbjT (DUF2867 family)